MDNKLSELSKPVDFLKSAALITARNFERWSKLAAMTSESSSVLHSTTLLETAQLLSTLLAELEAKDDALRAVAFHVSSGGYNADSVDAEVFKHKIIDGINDISDVLAKRIAELEEQSNHLKKELHNEGAANAHAYERIRELEKRLATPVRLPDVLFIKVSGSAVPVMHAERVKERVQAAGFKCVGDE